MSKPAERSAARLAAVQALYQLELSAKSVIDVFAEFEAFWIGREVDGVVFEPSDVGFFREVVAGVVENQVAVDRMIDGALASGWPLRRVEAVLRAILRGGAYELMFRKDVPARVAISEYLRVAESFYGEDEPGLVNAVLDGVAREARPGELERRAAGRT